MTHHAFTFGEEQKKYAAFVGSPTATNEHLEYQDNYSSSNEDSFDLGVTSRKSESRVVLLSASVHGAIEAQKTYSNCTSYRAIARRVGRDTTAPTWPVP